METFSALLAICAGNSPVPGEFPTQRPVTRSFDVYFDLRPNKRLSKQSWGWWFETPSCSLWRHRNVIPKNVFRDNRRYLWCNFGMHTANKRNECLGWSGHMLTSRNGNIFWLNGALWGKSTGHRCIAPKESSDAELQMMFFLCVPEKSRTNVGVTVDLSRHVVHVMSQ